jgi:hypothetical protein
MSTSRILILPFALALLGCGGNTVAPPTSPAPAATPKDEAAPTSKGGPAADTARATAPRRDTGPSEPPAPAPAWTLDVKNMRFPDGPASGKVAGQAFKVDAAELDNGSLILRQGEDGPDGLEVHVVLSFRAKSFGGKSYEVTPGQKDSDVPTVTLNGKGTEDPKGPRFFKEYAMRLEFGQEKDGKLPGKIYLCLPDAAKSHVAGTFDAVIEPDYTRPLQPIDAPYVAGKVALKGRDKYDLLVGIVGLTAEGEPFFNAAGMEEVTPGVGTLQSSKASKAQRTALVNDLDAGCSYRHIRLAPGRYLVYARHGDRFLDGRWVEVKDKSAIARNLSLEPDTAGVLEVTLPKGAKGDVQLFPLNEDGKLPDLKGARRWVAAALKTDVMEKDGKVVLDGLRPGAYRVIAGTVGKDVTVKAKETAKIDLSAP